jgi:probable F420-dependent oxidoreductase
MKIGAAYPQNEFQGDPEIVSRFGLAVEELGFDHLLVYDHVVGATHDREPKLWGPYTEKDPFHDPFIMFAYLAAITKRIEFVTGILVLPQRQTVIVAKQTTDIDLLSGGRLRLGVATGWNYVEFDALGIDYKSRGRRLDEQVGYLRKLWSEPLVTFTGEFDKIDRGNILPRPKRRIPIWIGGHADAGFRRGALLGDGFIFSTDIEAAETELGRVNHFLAESGRKSDTFGKEMLIRFGNKPAEVIERIEKWRDLGGTHVCVATMGKGLTSIDAHIDFLAEVKHRFKT